ncbi:type III secretion system chaperone [Mailhella massiliensis]|uniref:Type III secretion system chaperone n=1 Tax=Mailhella massiliensis TaxID=1903261 RepID=A0A921AUV3_9BACT|nr:type III secretion system chaperone [Mailhella massiliensis]HJD96325.1 type III secretion system chaperone [Mailhella massiliensis]
MSQYVPYLEALNRETGLDIQLSASGGAQLMLEGRGMLLQWLEAQAMFIVYIELGTLSGWRDEEVLRQLLSANFLLLQTEGGALSYHPAANMVGMNYAISVYGLTAEDFVRRLDAVILLAEQWQERLRRMEAEQEKLAVRAVEGGEETPSDADPYVSMQMLRI